MGKRKSTETRMIVLEILMELLPGKESVSAVKSNLLIRDVLEKYDYMDARDRALIKRLAEGCIEQKIRLDYVLDQYSKTKTDKMKPVILNILRMGVYQILCMDAVPDAAACNEAVNLAIDKGFYGLKGFVNGVLRTVSREKENIPMPSREETGKYLSVCYSMPEWLVHKWLGSYDAETVETMLASMQKSSGITVRLREDLTEQQRLEWIREVMGQKCLAEPHPYLSYAYTLKNVEGVAGLYGFSEGVFTVQDISSMLAVECAGIRKGDFVMDVCAAPGGKTMHAADKTGPEGLIEARDVSEQKTALILENAERLQPGMLEAGHLCVRVWDARTLDEEMIGRADVVLADLPCSGLGVIRHKGDIRYRMSARQIEELAELQKEILGTAYRYLKPGGILLYSTCTISDEENGQNRKWALENLPLEAAGMEIPDSLKECFPEELQKQMMKEGYFQLLPGIHQSDGFFVAKFRRKREHE